MFKILIPLCALLLSCHCATLKNCDPLKNIKATIYTGAQNDPQQVTLTGKDDLNEAYKVIIDDQTLDTICSGTFNDLKHLDTLTIRNSKVSTLEPGAFLGCTDLRTLDLSHNEIDHISTGVFNDLNIRRVNLTSNRISSIDTPAFDHMPKLEVVELNNNHISKFDPKWFKSSPKVYRIVMDHNQLKSIPKNALSNLVESTERPHPMHLWLSHNRITTVDEDAFKGIKEIESLWLDHNQITQFQDETFKNIKLGNLAVDANELGCLSKEFLKNLETKDLMIDLNPMDCDCLRALRKWAAKNSVEMTAIRRGLECLKEGVNKAMDTQKKYYEDQLTMERNF